jgi:hypothetical protein
MHRHQHYRQVLRMRGAGLNANQEKIIAAQPTQALKDARRLQFENYNKQLDKTIGVQPVLAELNRDDIIGTYDGMSNEQIEEKNRYIDDLRDQWVDSGKKDFKDFYYTNTVQFDDPATAPKSESGSPALEAKQSRTGAWTIYYSDGTREITRSRNLDAFAPGVTSPEQAMERAQGLLELNEGRLRKREEEEQARVSGTDRFFERLTDGLTQIADVASAVMPGTAATVYDTFRPGTSAERREARIARQQQQATEDIVNTTKTLAEQENEKLRGRLAPLLKHDERLRSRVEEEDTQGKTFDRFLQQGVEGGGKDKQRQKDIDLLRGFLDSLQTPDAQKAIKERSEKVKEQVQTDMLIRAVKKGEPKAKSIANQLLDQLGTASEITDKVPGLGTATKALKGLDFANQLRQATGQVLSNTAEQFAPGATSNPILKNILGAFGAGRERAISVVDRYDLPMPPVGFDNLRRLLYQVAIENPTMKSNNRRFISAIQSIPMDSDTIALLDKTYEEGNMPKTTVEVFTKFIDVYNKTYPLGHFPDVLWEDKDKVFPDPSRTERSSPVSEIEGEGKKGKGKQSYLAQSIGHQAIDKKNLKKVEDEIENIKTAKHPDALVERLSKGVKSQRLKLYESYKDGIKGTLSARKADVDDKLRVGTVSQGGQIYCGNKRTPPGKTKGTRHACFKKGVGVGMMLEQQKAPQAPPEKVLEEMTIRELGQVASRLKVPRYSRMKRAELIEAIQAIRTNNP